MKRRTFDLLVTIGGIGLALAMVAMGLVFLANASFAKSNVQDQLEAQRISFPPAEALTDEERAQPGVVRYAGQQVVDGEMAEVYANQYIGLHLQGIGGGKTYSELSRDSRADPDNAELAGKVQTAFRGETLRGLLLTTYAFWTLGEKAEQTATVLFAGAGVLLVLAFLGLWHYARTPKREQLKLDSLVPAPGNGPKTKARS